MFELKKIISSFLIIPGIFILFLIVTGIYGAKKRNFIFKLNLLIGIILYCFSISFISGNLLHFIEKENIYSGKPAVDAIILLGGGFNEGVPDLSGTGVPSPDMTMRIVDTVRLYKKYKLPIVVSGGSVSGKMSEAAVAKRFMTDLGVKESDIIIEDASRDTVENALYVKEIFNRKGYKKGLIVTSAYHIRRSEFIFKHAGLDIYVHSSGISFNGSRQLTIYDFLPSIGSLNQTANAAKEATGLLFYQIKYKILF
jgi:uncharacterized SAM-binding protein YcdF (DUF218 family)